MQHEKLFFAKSSFLDCDRSDRCRYDPVVGHQVVLVEQEEGCEMKGSLLIVLGIVAVIGGALFGDQVMALFAGMSPLEMLRMIVTFVLHVAVATILSFVAFTAPELLKPWMRTLRRKRRAARRGEPVKATMPRAPKMNYAALASWLLNRQNTQSAPRTRQQPPTISPSDDENHLNF